MKHVTEAYHHQVAMLHQFDLWFSMRLVYYDKYIHAAGFNPVVVTSEMMDQTHTKGDVVTFTCRATSEPISNNIISWYFNAIPVNESNKYHISTQRLLNYATVTNILIIMSVESSDVGTYTCYATNEKSTDMSFAVLSVSGKQFSQSEYNWIATQFHLLANYNTM